MGWEEVEGSMAMEFCRRIDEFHSPILPLVVPLVQTSDCVPSTLLPPLLPPPSVYTFFLLPLHLLLPIHQSYCYILQLAWPLDDPDDEDRLDRFPRDQRL